LKTAGWKILKNVLGLPERLAESIRDEKMSYDPHRPFADEADFRQRIQAWYGNKKRPVNFETKYWLPLIKPLIDSGREGF
jgi:hypothetical protein